MTISSNKVPVALLPNESLPAILPLLRAVAIAYELEPQPMGFCGLWVGPGQVDVVNALISGATRNLEVN